MSSSSYRIPSLIEKQILEQDTLFNTFKSQFNSIGLNYKQTDDVVRLMASMVTEKMNCIQLLLKSTTTEPEKIVKDVLGNCLKGLQSMDSRLKR